MKNRFQTLGDIEDPEKEDESFLEVYREAAKKIIGMTKKQSKRPWMGDET